MTEIGFIRHGITDWNIESRIQGLTDIPLNETGRKQAMALANRIKNEEWDVIYSSDLSRAVETAEIVADALGLKVNIDKRIREMGCGLSEGTTLAERIEKWGEDWESIPKGVESDESITGRGISFIKYVHEKYQNKRVLVVSHGAFVGRTLKKIIPYVDTEKHLDNTSITILKYLDNKWDCRLYNCTAHVVKD